MESTWALLIAVAALPTLGGCRSAQPPAESIPTVGVGQVVANPANYSHRIIRLTGCLFIGFEKTVLQPCGDGRPKQEIWLEDAAVGAELRGFPPVPGYALKELQGAPQKRKEAYLFPYDRAQNSEVWHRLGALPENGSMDSPISLQGQFETIEPKSPGITGFGHLGAYANELVVEKFVDSKAEGRR
jgi:hypothetical protein